MDQRIDTKEIDYAGEKFLLKYYYHKEELTGFYMTFQAKSYKVTIESYKLYTKANFYIGDKLRKRSTIGVVFSPEAYLKFEDKIRQEIQNLKVEIL